VRRRRDGEGAAAIVAVFIIAEVVRGLPRNRRLARSPSDRLSVGPSRRSPG